MNVLNMFKKKKEEKIETDRDYEQYEKELKEAQDEELHSARFEFVTVFMNMINGNNNEDKERYLFRVILNERNRYLSRDYNKVKSESLEYYNALVKFINHLSEEEINSNYYFFVLKNVMDIIHMDLYSSISELKKLINDRSKLNIYRKTYKLNDCISELIPKKVPLTKEHSIQANVVYYSNTDPILDSEDIELYKEYNHVIDKLVYMLENIYTLALWNEISMLEEPVGLRTIKVRNVDGSFDLELCFALENNTNVKRSYIIDKRVTMLIGEVCGIPFDDMVNMNPKVLKERLDSIQQKRLIKK